MAPAAKAGAYGNTGRIIVTASAPATAATGSTPADNCPYHHALARDSVAAQGDRGES